MKNLILTFIVVLSSPLVCIQSAHAYMVSIQDNYIGGTATHSSYSNKDIVGTTAQFDISSMSMNMENNQLDISIRSSYFDNVGAYNTTFGDVFLSSDGWNPHGTGAFLTDDAYTGENWEYAIVFSDHGDGLKDRTGPGSSMIGQSGEAKLVKILKDSDIELSDSEYIHRTGQEYRVQGDSLQEVISLGTWSIENDKDGYSILNVSASLLGSTLIDASIIGAHFGFSCGNDVIEGSFAGDELTSTGIPEPGSALLLLSAMGIFPIRKRKHQ